MAMLFEGDDLEKVYAEYVAALDEFRKASFRLTAAKDSLRVGYVNAFRSGATTGELATQVPGLRASVLTDFKRAIAPFWKEHYERLKGVDDRTI